MRPIIVAASLLVAIAIPACTHSAPNGSGPARQVSFVQDIAPILEERCLVCHHRANAANCGGLNLETRQLAFSTGRNTPVIIPGEPEQSPLVAALLAREIHPVFMPPIAHRLSDSELELIQRWIAQGADWPVNSEGTLEYQGGSAGIE